MSEHEYYHQILHLYDEADRWETPSNFSFYNARNHFLSFAYAVQKQTKIICRIETDSAIQDASFIGQIMFPRAVALRQKHHAYGAIIRVSNFGNMATVTAEDIFPPPLLKTIKHIINEFEYTYIPPSILQEAYNGKGITGIRTWWIRYFDWL